MASLVLKLHGEMLRATSHALGVHCEGLQQAARHARRRDIITNKFARNMINLDIAFNIVRHLTDPRAQELKQELDRQLRAADLPAPTTAHTPVPTVAHSAASTATDSPESTATYSSPTCASPWSRRSARRAATLSTKLHNPVYPTTSGKDTASSEVIDEEVRRALRGCAPCGAAARRDASGPTEIAEALVDVDNHSQRNMVQSSFIHVPPRPLTPLPGTRPRAISLPNVFGSDKDFWEVMSKVPVHGEGEITSLTQTSTEHVPSCFAEGLEESDEEPAPLDLLPGPCDRARLDDLPFMLLNVPGVPDDNDVALPELGSGLQCLQPLVVIPSAELPAPLTVHAVSPVAVSPCYVHSPVPEEPEEPPPCLLLAVSAPSCSRTNPSAHRAVQAAAKPRGCTKPLQAQEAPHPSRQQWCLKEGIREPPSLDAFRAAFLRRLNTEKDAQYFFDTFEDFGYFCSVGVPKCRRSRIA